MKEKSCYVLEISVRLAGFEISDFFTYNNFAHIRSILEQEFLSEDIEALSVFTELSTVSDETIALWVIQASRLVKVIELRRYIIARFPNGLVYKLESEPLSEIEYDSVAEFEFKWKEIAKELPVLDKPQLQPGESLQLSDLSLGQKIPSSYLNYLAELGSDLEINYGMWNEEYGEWIEDFFIDPDPM